MSITDEELRSNIQTLLSAAAGKARVLAATKTVDVQTINKIYDMGIDLIGENRVQELMEKLPYLDKRFEIHFIGRLQRNKVKYIIGRVALIHSLDSVPLAEEIDKRAQKLGTVQECLVEVNLGNEDSKGGVPLEEVENFISSVSVFGHIKIVGLMGVVPNCGEKENLCAFFTKITKKFIDIKHQNVDNSIMSNAEMRILSLGMTHDYVQALECGSNLIRIGEGVFGARTYQKT
ncbi:MAG: YggS family pyridoxal phosphate-dependent enzyme [Clostridia bacterium]|nr:YggS family pyridoxal phosphate-dependent enzyme [Clostridia bacterium]